MRLSEVQSSAFRLLFPKEQAKLEL